MAGWKGYGFFPEKAHLSKSPQEPVFSPGFWGKTHENWDLFKYAKWWNIQVPMIVQIISSLFVSWALMVNWWFGLVVWIPGILWWKGSVILGAPIESQTTNPNHQLTISWHPFLRLHHVLRLDVRRHGNGTWKSTVEQYTGQWVLGKLKGALVVLEGREVCKVRKIYNNSKLRSIWWLEWYDVTSMFILPNFG